MGGSEGMIRLVLSVHILGCGYGGHRVSTGVHRTSCTSLVMRMRGPLKIT